MSNLYPDESISVDKCWERLHANTLGRLILTDGQHVDVLPVLYAVASQDDKQEIYIRTTRGNKFSSVVVSRRVAFEIDETLEDGIRSVIVVGIAHWLPPEMTPQIRGRYRPLAAAGNDPADCAHFRPARLRNPRNAVGAHCAADRVRPRIPAAARIPGRHPPRL